MPDCTKPTDPGPGAPEPEQLCYALKYAEYLQCLANKGAAVNTEIDELVSVLKSWGISIN